MNLYSLYNKILNADYKHISKETASYAVQRNGNTLYLLFE